MQINTPKLVDAHSGSVYNALSYIEPELYLVLHNLHRLCFLAKLIIPQALSCYPQANGDEIHRVRSVFLTLWLSMEHIVSELHTS